MERHEDHHRPTIESLLQEVIRKLDDPRVVPDETVRRLLHEVLTELHTFETNITRKVNKLMSLSQRELAAFAALIADIDEKFTAANAPLIAELRAQLDALKAEDDADQAEVDRLQALVDTAEQDTLDAIASVQEHVDNLGGTPTTTTTPAPEPPA